MGRQKNTKVDLAERKARRSANQKRYYYANRDKILARNARSAVIYKAAHREERAKDSRRRNLSKYNMRPEEYDAMLEVQSGVCLICGRPPKKIRLHVDHDHKTGKVRGLLCFQCNNQVVLVLDRYPRRIHRALLYLKGKLRGPPKEPL